MIYNEFKEGMLKLSNKWPNISNKDQLEVFWHKWKHLPDFTFKTAVQMLLFKCVHCPSGERIQEEINMALSARSNNAPEKPKNNCDTCDGLGYLNPENKAGNSTVALCYSCNGVNLVRKDLWPTFNKAKAEGFYILKTSKSPRPEGWVDADKDLFSPMLIGAYNVIQMNLLIQGFNKGMNAVKKHFGINEEKCMRLYEAILNKQINAPIINELKNVPQRAPSF